MNCLPSLSLFAATVLLAAILTISQAGQQTLRLTGAMETPAIATDASGEATLNVDEAGLLSGGIKTSGIVATAAHIHMGGPGTNGLAIVTLEPVGHDQWVVPAGARLSVEQFAAFRKGQLYVNVHSLTHPAGEIRGQLEAPAGT
jgi:CHRD domain